MEELSLVEYFKVNILYILQKSYDPEERINAYLELNKLLRLEDTMESVSMLRTYLPPLLKEMYMDITSTAPRKDVIHISLRTLSYFMYHKGLISVFQEHDITRFLSCIIHLCITTKDEAIYKLCLWCFTSQNFITKDNPQVIQLKQIIEILVQALISNPFNSHEIKLQALKGLYDFIVKAPMALISSHTLFAVWWEPVLRNFTTKDLNIRQTVLLILQEVLQIEESQLVEESIQLREETFVNIVIPTLHRLMEDETTRIASVHYREMLEIWVLILSVLKNRFAKSLSQLNDLLYVPESAMQHEDSSIRQLAIKQWTALLPVFRSSQFWFCQKMVLTLLVRPIIVVFESENEGFNVLQAAYETWSAIVSITVQDFNVYCQSLQSSTQNVNSQQQKWKRWMDEVINKPLIAVLNHSLKSRRKLADNDAVRTTDEIMMQFFRIIEGMWSTNTGNTVHNSGNDLSGSTETVMASNSNVTSESNNVVALSNDLMCVAFTFTDVCQLIRILLFLSQHKVHTSQSVNKLVNSIWRGMCYRMSRSIDRSSTTKDDEMVPKLCFRLLRISLDFAWGVSDIATFIGLESHLKDQFPLITSEDIMVTNFADMLFSFQYQLQLFLGMFNELQDTSILINLVMHPKCLTKSQLISRIRDRIATLSVPPVFQEYLNAIEKDKTADKLEGTRWREKTATWKGLLLYIVLEYAVWNSSFNSKSNSIASNMHDIHANFVVVVPQITVCGHQVLDLQRYSISTNLFRDFILFCVETAKELRNRRYEIEVMQDKSQEKKIILPEELSVEQFFNCVQSKVRGGKSFSNNVLDLGMTAINSADEKHQSSASNHSEHNNMSPNLLSHSNSHFRNVSPNIISKKCDALEIEIDEDSEVEDMLDESQQAEAEGKEMDVGQIDDNATPTYNVSDGHIQRSDFSNADMLTNDQMVFPSLATCKEPISQIFRHFSLAFRPFFSFYKIKTIGDLSSLSISRVKTLGLKDPINKVQAALTEFQGRKDRLNGIMNSPHSMRSASLPPSPSPFSPSYDVSRSKSKTETHSISDLWSTRPRKKRRSLSFTNLTLTQKRKTADELFTMKVGAAQFEKNCMGDENADMSISRNDKQRVLFRLESIPGEFKIRRPGEESQEFEQKMRDCDEEEAIETVDDKRTQYTAKFMQHLHRATFYMENLSSLDTLTVPNHRFESDESGSLGTKALVMHQWFETLQQAQGMLEKISGDLAQTMQSRAKVFESNLLQKNKNDTYNKMD